jgi:hypothetical protein
MHIFNKGSAGTNYEALRKLHGMADQLQVASMNDIITLFPGFT